MRIPILFLIALSSSASASERVVMHAVNANGLGDHLGTISISETEYGLQFSPDLSGLTPGLHGFHLHQNGSCQPAEKDGKMVPALTAGGHYDPDNAGRHDLPWADGHRGDLPALYVNQDGRASKPVLAPRLTLADLPGRAVMIHAGGDNYSDDPKPLGGGGSRMSCGVISAD